MTIELSTVLSAFATIMTGVLGLLFSILRDNQKNERQKVESIDHRLNTEEKATIRQDGEILRMRDSHDGMAEDVRDIKQNMLTRAEWLQSRTGSAHTSAGAYRAVEVPRPDYPTKK